MVARVSSPFPDPGELHGKVRSRGGIVGRAKPPVEKSTMASGVYPGIYSWHAY